MRARGDWGMVEGLEIREAEPGDASDIAEIHLAARLPYVHRPPTKRGTISAASSAIDHRPGGSLGSETRSSATC
jgi:hypothetical protein